MNLHYSDEAGGRLFEWLGSLLGEAKRSFTVINVDEPRHSYWKALEEFADHMIHGKTHAQERSSKTSLLELPVDVAPSEGQDSMDGLAPETAPCTAKQLLQHRLEVALKTYSRSASMLTAYIHSQWELRPAIAESDHLFERYEMARKEFDEHVNLHGC